MARRTRILEWDLEVGDYKLILFTYNKESEVIEALEKHYSITMEHPGKCEGFVVADMNYVVLALKNGFSIPTLVHELQHLTFKMLDRCSIKLSEETEEVYAMQIDSLFKIVIDLLKEDKYKLPGL